MSEGSSLQSYLRFLRNRWWLILLFTVLVPAVAVALTLRQKSVYAASADVLVNRANLATTILGPPTSNDPPDRVVTTLTHLARSSELFRRVTRSVAGMSAGDLERNSKVQPIAGADILRFTVNARSPALAHTAVQSYASQFVAFLHAPKALTIRSDVPAEKVEPRPVRIGALTAVGGLIVGIGVALLLELVDPRLNSPSEIANALGLPLLARLPERRRRGRGAGPATLVDPNGLAAQRVRGFRVAFEHAVRRVSARKVMVTSASRGEGKSTVVADLGVALARAGYRVALVDLDLPRPALARLFRQDENAPGVTDIACGECTVEGAVIEIDVSRRAPRRNLRSFVGSGRKNDRSRSFMQRVDLSVPLRLVTAGTYAETPEAVLDGPAISEILEELDRSSDLVLVDAPPALVFPGSLSLFDSVDATLVVARRASARRRVLAELRHALADLPENLGLVVVDRRRAKPYEAYEDEVLVSSKRETEPAPGTAVSRTPTV